MSCECENITCIETKWDPCSDGARLPITATETEDWTAEIEFNNTWSLLSFGVTAGQNVIFPTEFLNEHYSHLLKIFDGAGALLNGTCYSLKSRAMTSGGTYTPIAPGVGALYALELEGNNTNTIGADILTGKTILTVEFSGQSYTSDFFTHNFSEITFNIPDTVFTGTVVIYYKL